MKPILSIIMPVYNVDSEFLHESIDSVLNQTFGEYEFLIIDDGSTNGCIDIIKTYSDKRINIILNHHNFIDSLNKGVNEANGKYIVRMDADDIMLPNRLQEQFDFMESHPEIDVCGSWAEIFGSGQGTIRTHTEHGQIVSSMLLYNPVVHPSVMIHRKVWEPMAEAFYPYGYPCAEDYKLWTNLAVKGFRFANIPAVLLKYRCSNSQVTSSRHKEMHHSTLRIRMEYAQEVMEKIINEKEQYSGLFEQLIELYNNDLIEVESLSGIIYQIYSYTLKIEQAII